MSTENVARSGEGFLKRLFGNKEGVVVDGVAASSGVSRSAASKVLGLASQLVLGFVGREAVTRNMDASGLRGFLASLRSQAAGAMPRPLANVFGGPTPTQGPAITPIPHRSTSGTWLLAGLVVLGALALLMWRRNAHHKAALMSARQSEQAAMEAVRPRPLSAGTRAGELSQALDGREALPQRFVVSGLRFQMDSAAIEPGSATVLDDVASILTRHPTARIRVEGQTAGCRRSGPSRRALT
jgi:HAMP domain-containing protein